MLHSKTVSPVLFVFFATLHLTSTASGHDYEPGDMRTYFDTSTTQQAGIGRRFRNPVNWPIFDPISISCEQTPHQTEDGLGGCTDDRFYLRDRPGPTYRGPLGRDRVGRMYQTEPGGLWVL